MHEPIFSPFRPASGDFLRRYLAASISETDLRFLAEADHGRDADAIYHEFRLNLAEGGCAYAGDGNMYECCTLMLHDGTPPLCMLFAVWWLGTYCSGPDSIVLIDNLSYHVERNIWFAGFEVLLQRLRLVCKDLGPRAAHAAVPFLSFLHTRDPSPNDDLYRRVARSLAVIESRSQ